ncbi:MAG: type ISP restriction/modification enzyme [Blastocatellia bacterium]
MDPVEAYIRELRDIRSSGEAVAETSYYGALATLLNEVGKTLKPKIRCIVNIKNRGAGIPDGGLFTADQFQKSSGAEPLKGQAPSRGVIEVKPASGDAWVTAEGPQVSKYWGKYGQVLVTNYRDFVLVGRDEEGRAAKLETYRLAPTEHEFWSAAQSPRRFAEEHGGRLVEYLKRVMLHAAQLASPEDVAWFLASYARDARARIERAELPALAAVRAALEEALGLKFEGEKGERFFRSTLVQTLFYGVFSAWVLWGRGRSDRSARFDWKQAAWSLRVPMISALFEQVAMPSRLGPLGLVEVLDWTAAALNRVAREEFFKRFEEEHAVQYFYEPFLEAFDPVLRKELGVWYTPKEIVEYMVARVDRVLREELDLPDGLADPRVYVLDPCCGTGAYLVEVLRRIAVTLRERGDDALVSSDIKRAAKERVFGFEILPAPFVVAHLQLGLMLQNLGAPLGGGPGERVGVYLTNALTGWEPPKGPKQHLMFKEMEEERDAAEHVKREVPVLVVLGNPPYNGFAGVAVAEERDLSNAYRTTKRAAAPQGQGLNDLYIRFFRMAERRIVEKTGEGVVCFISNYSWLDGLSFTGMRERYLEAFDHIWIDSLNGDKYKTGKLTPEGEPDPSVFSTDFNKEGIQVGTAIALLVRNKSHENAEEIQFRNLWGKTKRARLLETAEQVSESLYQKVRPAVDVGLPFMPTEINIHYFAWPLLPDLFPISFPGVKTSRDDVVVDIDRERLVQRMEKYFDPATSHEEMRRLFPGAMENASGFDAEPTRDYLRRRGFLTENIIRYCYRPFDVRWLYWEPETKLLDRNRAEYFSQLFEGNLCIAAAQQNRKEFNPPYVSCRLCSLHIIERGANLFPLCIRDERQDDLFAGQSFGNSVVNALQFNVSASTSNYLTWLGAAGEVASFFYHTIAVLHAPMYSVENAGALRQDWPRVPLPDLKEALEASSRLGREIAALLDTETPVPNVTTGAIRPELKSIAVVSSAGGASLNPEAGDLALTAGWGHGGKGGVTMPGKGKIVARDYSDAEMEAIEQGARSLNLSPEVAARHLGATTLDIYLNEKAYWKNVPAKVWDYTIGGYQVIKKWLSYREKELLGRALTADEAREVMAMARRIAAILLLEPALDANYESVKQSSYAWPSEKERS